MFNVLVWPGGTDIGLEICHARGQRGRIKGWIPSKLRPRLSVLSGSPIES